MNLNLDHLYQQIMDTEQQVHNRVAHVAERNTNLFTNLFTFSDWYNSRTVLQHTGTKLGKRFLTCAQMLLIQKAFLQRFTSYELLSVIKLLRFLLFFCWGRFFTVKQQELVWTWHYAFR